MLEMDDHERAEIFFRMQEALNVPANAATAPEALLKRPEDTRPCAVLWLATARDWSLNVAAPGAGKA